MKMRLLVVSQSYPSKEKPHSQAFIHSRNIEYKKDHNSVDVCSFSTQSKYEYDGISVYGDNQLPSPVNQYDLIVFHAPNIRNHVRFIIRHWSELKNIVFIFHGYEIMRVQDHVEPYFKFLKPAFWKRMIVSLYDSIKIPIISTLIRVLHKNKNTHFIFVSGHFRDSVISDLEIAKSALQSSSSVIHNPVNSIFYEKSFEPSNEILADFITIRPFDEPKYGVDIVINIAKLNPTRTFHIYGMGELFNHIDIPPNVSVYKKFLEQKNLPELLNHYRFALMPSRWDSQGVMSCEMAVYGIPVITSDLPVFKEVLGGFENVRFVDNDNPQLDPALKGLVPISHPKSRFNVEKTVSLELNIFNRLVAKQL